MKHTCAGIGKPASACLPVLFRHAAPPFSAICLIVRLCGALHEAYMRRYRKTGVCMSARPFLRTAPPFLMGCFSHPRFFMRHPSVFSLPSGASPHISPGCPLIIYYEPAKKAAASFCLQPPFASNHLVFSIFSLSFCPTLFSFRLADRSPS